MELTVDDLEILVKAVTTWENAPVSDAFVSDMFRMAMSLPDKDPIDKVKERYNDLAVSRSEQAVLLKAKLINMRNGLIDKTVRAVLDKEA